MGNADEAKLVASIVLGVRTDIAVGNVKASDFLKVCRVKAEQYYIEEVLLAKLENRLPRYRGVLTSSVFRKLSDNIVAGPKVEERSDGDLYPISLKQLQEIRSSRKKIAYIHGKQKYFRDIGTALGVKRSTAKMTSQEYYDLVIAAVEKEGKATSDGNDVVINSPPRKKAKT